MTINYASVWPWLVLRGHVTALPMMASLILIWVSKPENNRKELKIGEGEDSKNEVPKI